MLKFDPNINPYPSTRKPIYAKNGMVATSQPLAANAGLEILKKGGNAVDAAVATAAALTVVEPCSNGIGSDAFAIVWLKDKMYGLNSSGPSPQALTIEAVKKLGHAEIPRFGWLPVTVPGTPSAWANLIKRFGKLSLSEDLEPATHLAEEGFPVSPEVGYYWKRAYNIYKKELKGKEFSEWFETFAPNGKVPEVGDIAFLPNHAKTLKEIGETQAESFYRGNLAAKIAEASATQGGFLSKEDLATYQPEWVKPVTVNYHGYDVWELPPNGQGIVALMALNILKDFEFKAKESVETYHLQFEAMKQAFTAGKKYITEESQMSVKTEELLSETFAAAAREKISTEAAELDPDLTTKKGGTVYLAAADKEGNMVSYIQSNYMGFGSGIVIPGTGIAMQNRGYDFSLDEMKANCLAPGKRTYHTIIPGFLTKDNQAVGPFGVMGGYMQPQGHVQVLMNAIDFQLNPQAALDAPRWQWLQGKSFIVEKNFPTDIALALKEKGHDIQVTLDSGSFGRGEIIWRDAKKGVLVGGTESRCDGYIAHW